MFRTRTDEPVDVQQLAEDAERAPQRALDDQWIAARAVDSFELRLDQPRGAAVHVVAGVPHGAYGGEPRSPDAHRARLERRPENRIRKALLDAEVRERVHLRVRDP